MDKKTIVLILEEIALILEIVGENQFKTRAYINAARMVATTQEDLEKLAAENKLQLIKGIGAGLSEKLAELITTGHSAYYEKLKKSIPLGLLEMRAIPSLGPRKIKNLYDKLHIHTIGELEYACKENRLIDLDGFGKKTQDKILSGIVYIKKNKVFHHINAAMADAATVLNYLKKTNLIKDISLAGSLRRSKEIVKDIDIVATSDKPNKVMAVFTSFPGRDEIIAQGQTKSSIRLPSGINADLRVVSAAEFPYALHHFTGSKEHNIAMRSRAQAMHIKINEYGLFKNNTRITCKTEKELFNQLKLQYIPPELRENRGEIEAAEKNAIPQLINEKAITGLFHVHTDMSDGETSLEKMAEIVRNKGYQYIGISDHSKSAFYAGGLKEAAIKQQHILIDSLNKKMNNFYIFKGIESDILPDGSLDYDDAILKTFDFVIAAIHSNFNMTESDMTKRIIRAMKNKQCTMLGHMTGRLLLAREAYPLNHRDIIQAAADYGVIIELNANPYRLDIDWKEIKRAKDKNVLISINCDAHDPDDLGYIRYGVGIARKGWLTKENVFNTKELSAVKKYLSQKKAS